MYFFYMFKEIFYMKPLCILTDIKQLIACDMNESVEGGANGGNIGRRDDLLYAQRYSNAAPGEDDSQQHLVRYI